MSTSRATKPPAQVYVFDRSDGPGCLVQAVWFIFVGWWLGALVISAAWILNITIIGLPLGMALLNNIPKVLALQDPEKQLRAVTADGIVAVTETDQPQVNWLIRSVYFVLIGWWWSGIWLSAAYLISATVVLLPIGLRMFRLTPRMTTLRRY